MYKTILPQTASGNYWISDNNGHTERKLLSIEGIDGNWQISSNNHVKILLSRPIEFSDNNNIVINPKNARVMDRVVLKEYDKYIAYFENTGETFILFCFPVYDNNFIHLNMKNISEIKIGRNINNDIIYTNELISNVHAKISLINGKWSIENYDKKIRHFC